MLFFFFLLNKKRNMRHYFDIDRFMEGKRIGFDGFSLYTTSFIFIHIHNFQSSVYLLKATSVSTWFTSNASNDQMHANCPIETSSSKRICLLFEYRSVLASVSSVSVLCLLMNWRLWVQAWSFAMHQCSHTLYLIVRRIHF